MAEQIVEKIKREAKDSKKVFQERTTALIIGGFSFVAALAWNEAIKSLVDTYFKASSGLIGKFVYALIITATVVIVSIRLEKISEKKE